MNAADELSPALRGALLEWLQAPENLRREILFDLSRRNPGMARELTPLFVDEDVAWWAELALIGDYAI